MEHNTHTHQTEEHMFNPNDFSPGGEDNVVVGLLSAGLAILNYGYGWFHAHFVPSISGVSMVIPIWLSTLLNQALTAAVIGFIGSFMGVVGKKVFEKLAKKMPWVKKNKPTGNK